MGLHLPLAAADGVPLDAVMHRSADRERRGAVILAHGITVDMDEGGMFVRLAECLAAEGFTTLRFSFRGHGKSGGSQRGATIAGEMLDLDAAVGRATQEHDGPLAIVAASYGAVSGTLSLPFLDQLQSLVLWNPVLDLRHTFLEPELPWGRENFGPRQQEELRRTGVLLVDGTFELGRVMFQEMERYDPRQSFVESRVPALVIHGDRDSYVSYDIARSAGGEQGADFHTILGSDHGFDSPAREDEAIRTTVEWLVRRHPREA
jgi:pimeloyl-ACP methyl ester carboxylesterase